ncbi:ComEC/Rec2 family competence protein [Roseateles sp. DC23W]|uniref:ComEC/Rec2 family competence protein n=1 Tax=Pelomonas dachongensis TaxID=3299029 RepID=A0ABW7EU11_9BURK
MSLVQAQSKPATLAQPKPQSKPAVAATAATVKQLQIHYINVEQGGATLIVGPNGTKIMYDFGNLPGGKNIGKYLREKVGMREGDPVHYAIVSHADKDHYLGYKHFVEKDGFNVSIANYEPGTTKSISRTMKSHWLDPAQKTWAKKFKPIPVGLRIALGDGAEAHVVAANGVVLGETTSPAVRNENDRSIALFIRHGNFSYILDGDLGGGNDPCTDHQTSQKKIQERVARALVAHDLIPEGRGVSVMHVAHHGSESSTPSGYYNAMQPEVAVISVGDNQGSFLHPREDVIDKVLLQTVKVSCSLVPPVKAVFQTSEARPKEPCSSTGCISTKGLVAGSFVITTDGRNGYDIKTEKAVKHGKDVKAQAPPELLWHFDFPK